MSEAKKVVELKVAAPQSECGKAEVEVAYLTEPGVPFAGPTDPKSGGCKVLKAGPHIRLREGADGSIFVSGRWYGRIASSSVRYVVYKRP